MYIISIRILKVNWEAAVKYLGSMKEVDGVLEIGGVLVTQLQNEYGTPLYI